MAAAEAAKSTAEQFTAASNVAFKEGVEKSLAAMNELNTHSKKNLEAVVAAATPSAQGAEALGAQAMAFSKAVFDTQASDLAAPRACRKSSSCRPASPRPPWKPTWPSSPRCRTPCPPR